MGVRGGEIDWRKISSLLRSDIGYCFSASATRLDEILPLWKNTELLWAIFGMFNIVVGQRLDPTLAVLMLPTGQILIALKCQRLKNNLAIWSHW